MVCRKSRALAFKPLVIWHIEFSGLDSGIAVVMGFFLAIFPSSLTAVVCVGRGREGLMICTV